MKHFKLMKGVLACLLSLVLVATSAAPATEISATETATTTTTVTKPNEVAAGYNPDNDTITNVTSTTVVYVLKKESGNTIKKGAKCYTCSGTAADNTLLAIGVKGTNKDTYLYVCDKEFEETATGIKANLVIKAQAAKKITGVVDYTQADVPASTEVLSLNAVDSSKKKIDNPQLIWSEDGTTWKTAAEFDGAELVKKLEAGGATIQVKMLGTASPAVRTSKAVKVKIAKQGKAPTVKVDVKKDTFSIKNGMDFAVFVKNGEKYDLVGSWQTVLPQLKTAATKTLDLSIVGTTTAFKPVDKKDANAAKAAADNSGKVSYTALKVKALSYGKLIEKIDIRNSVSGGYNDATEYYIGVRTSATAKKPASAVTYFKYSEKTESPIVYTESCVSGQYLVSTGTDFAKKGILLNTIANYNGVNGTEGYDDEFKLKTTAGSGADTAAGSYEFAIINQADLPTVDWSTVAWKKLDPAKTKINAKLKTKYSTVNGTTTKQVTAVLTAAAKPENFTATASVPEDVKTVIVVRRAGVKGKTADDAVVASEYIELYVLKDGKNYEIYSTESVGDVAYQYTVDFYKLSLSGEGTSARYVYKKDDSLTIKGWGNSGEETFALPTVENADFFEMNANLEPDDKISASGGKCGVEVGTQAVTKNIAIKQKANVKILAAISGETTTQTLFTITNGKSSISGDTTDYYVGDEITISSGSGSITPITGYNLSLKTNVTSPAEGFAAVDSNGNIKTTVYTAEETTVKVTYVKSARTFSFIAGNNSNLYTIEEKDNCLGENHNQATYGVDIKLEIKPADGKKINSVTYKIGDNGTVTTLTGVNNIYTIPGNVILDTVNLTVNAE